MKRNATILVPFLILALAFAAFGQQRGPAPQGAPGMPGFGGPGGASALADYLALTAEQKTARETIQSDLRTSEQSLHEQERTLAESLRTALDAGSNDAAALGNILIQMRTIQSQIKAAHDAADAKFTALLTADQKTKFAAFQAASDFLRQRGPGGPR